MPNSAKDNEKLIAATARLLVEHDRQVCDIRHTLGASQRKNFQWEGRTVALLR